MSLIKMLIDVIMKLLGMKSEPAGLPSAGAPHAHAHGARVAEAPHVEAEPQVVFDVAGFNIERDEDAFWEAMLYMESEGMIAPNVTIGEEDRERTMRTYGIRDREHWDVVKHSCYAVMGRTSTEAEVNQRMVNHRMGMTQKLMQAATSSATKSGELNPVEGISLEQWAALNAALAQGASLADILKGQGVDTPRWDRARAEWEARMSRDTTFVIAQIYGAAFQNASQGKYSSFAKEANAARVDNRDLRMEPPMSLEEYWSMLYEQAYAAKQGKDPNEALKAMGLSAVDWCDLSAFMGYHINRTIMLNPDSYRDTMKRVEASFAAKYPGVKADVDIAF
jgi:hypothetical protein